MSPFSPVAFQLASTLIRGIKASVAEVPLISSTLRWGTHTFTIETMHMTHPANGPATEVSSMVPHRMVVSASHSAHMTSCGFTSTYCRCHKNLCLGTHSTISRYLPNHVGGQHAPKDDTLRWTNGNRRDRVKMHLVP